MEYSDYSDTNITYIGSIPATWQIAKIKNVSEFMPKADLSSLHPDDEVTFAPMECIKRGHFENHSRKLKDIDGSYTQFAEGDIVLAKVTPCFENGNLSIMNNLFSGIGFGSSELFVLRPTHILDRYLFYFLQHNGFINAACATMTGTGGLKRVSSDFVKNCYIPFPSSEEQSAIANYLDRKVFRIDSIIEEARASIEEYKAWKSSIIYEAVTKGLDPTAEMKDSGVEWIGKIPAHWQILRIKNIGDTRNGLTYSPDDMVDEGQGTLVLRSSNVQNGKLCFEDNVYVNMSIPSELIMHKGDVLVCSRNGSRKLIGKNAYIPEDNKYSFGAFMMVYRPFIHNSRYTYWILNSGVFDYYLPMFFTSTINQLTRENFRNMLVPFCSNEKEQEEISKYLDSKCESIDSLISEKESLITDLEAYKKSLIFEVVTGKRKVV